MMAIILLLLGLFCKGVRPLGIQLLIGFKKETLHFVTVRRLPPKPIMWVYLCLPVQSWLRCVGSLIHMLVIKYEVSHLISSPI